MKDQVTDRWIILPFSMSCVSESSICIGGGDQKGITKRSSSSVIRTKQKSKQTSSGLSFPSRKPSSTCGFRFQRLIKNLRTNISHLFGDDEEEEETEMEIGLPTDVKHLTHIGWDGSTTINTISNCSINHHQPFKGWEDNNNNNNNAPSISLKQFEMAMAAQADQNNLQTFSSSRGSNTTSSSETQQSWSSPVRTCQNNNSVVAPPNIVAHQ